MTPCARRPFFSVLLPGRERPSLFLYREDDLSGSPAPAFDCVDADGVEMHGSHDLSCGTLRIATGPDRAVTLPDSDVSWTGACVSRDDATGETRPTDGDFPEGSTLLYSGWFQHTPKELWSAQMNDPCDLECDDHHDLDEDSAYEAANDPERRAVAMAYAA